MTSSNVEIQTSPESVPSMPPWMGELTIVAYYLTHLGLLERLAERVRFARARFGIYDPIDFVVVLIGYAVSAEPTLKAFYERLLPFAVPFMALFGRDQLPDRSTLSRFLKAIDQPTVEALRSLFQEDLTCRAFPEQDKQTGGLQDRYGEMWEVFDADGTRQAARQRALPHSEALPRAHRRLDRVCAAGYTGRKRGEVVRTRTTLLLAHTQQWFATFGNSGNGEYRGELLRVIGVLTQYAAKRNLPLARIILRLDGQYGDFAVIIDLASHGICYLTRGKDYGLLDLPQIQARLALPAEEVLMHPETGTSRMLFDCPKIPLPGTALTTRVIIATHPTSGTPASVGTTRDGVVYELFFTALPPVSFTAADVVTLYLHRGAFETVLSDEDKEQDPDRWVSQTPCGQEFWQILSQWIWNLRLELGHRFHPTALRLTEFAQAQPTAASGSAQLDLPAPPSCCSQASPSQDQSTHSPVSDHCPGLIYGPAEFARTPRSGKFAGTDFELQPDGTLRCPAKHPLYAEARRPEHEGTVRVLYAARLPDCRGCLLREQCLGHGEQTTGPRRVSAVLRPVEGPSPPPERGPELAPPTQPLLWSDWSRCHTRRAFVDLLRTQTVTISARDRPSGSQEQADPRALTRQLRAHWRLSWQERLSRNAAKAEMPRISIHLFGIPSSFSSALGLAAA
jgi:hypothetical protein